jgi:chromosome segregation ATPase
MTFEEIQTVIEGMLAVQRDIQENQINSNERFKDLDLRLERITQLQSQTDAKIDRLSAKIDNLTENVSNLNIVSQRHEDRFTQYYGYHQSADSDRLNLLESQRRIERRLDRIEDKLDAR